MKTSALVAGTLTCALLAVWASSTSSREPFTRAMDIAVDPSRAAVAERLEVEAEPASPQDRVHAAGSELAPESTRELVHDGSLAGIVRRLADRPWDARSAEIRIRFERARIGESRIARRGAVELVGRPEANGEFLFTGLTPGFWRVMCSADGFGPERTTVWVRSERAPARVELELRARRHVNVTVTDPRGGSLLADLDALQRPAGDDPLRLFACAAEPVIGGNCAIEGARVSCETRERVGSSTSIATVSFLEHERIWIGLRLGTVTLASQELGPSTDQLVFTLSARSLQLALGSLRVVVVDDETSEPIEGARIRVLPRCADAVTDATGSARLEGLVPGPCSAEVVDLFRHVSSAISFTVSSRTCTQLEVRLQRSVRISGSLQDESGRLRDGELRSVAITEDPRLRGIMGSTSGPDGSFTFACLARGEYVVMDAALRPLPPDRLRDRAAPLPPGFVYVDARNGSVEGVVVRSPLGFQPR